LKEVVLMEKEIAEDAKYEGYVGISTVIDELERDLPKYAASPIKKGKTASGKEAILEVLARAADDHKFLARLAEDPAKVLREYDLTLEERAALASGDLRRIESWVGKLDKRLSTWIWCRLQQEKW
jgi:hypothetical protein